MRESVTTVVLLGMFALAGCGATAEREAAAGGSVGTGVSAEIKRICALPESERQAEIDRVKNETGVVVRCRE